MKIKNLLTTLTLMAIFLFVGKVGWGQVTGDFRSAATGNWNAPATWQRYSSTSTWEAFGVGENTGTGLPLTTSSVFILDGHTVTINQDVTVVNLNIGEGTSGVLTFDPTAVRAVVVSGNITIATGGTFITQSATTRTHTLSIGGDLTNNGEFDMSRGGSTLICNVTFNKPGDQTISGSGTLTRFRLITLDKTSISNRVLCSANVTFGASSTITYTAGTWEQTANTLTVTSGSQNIASANGALVFSGSGSLSMAIAGSIAVTGKLEVNTSGTFSVGSGNNSISTAASTSTINFLAGNININGRFTLNQGNTTINGANINIDPQVGTTYLGATSQAMEVSGTANLSFNSGSVTFVDPLNATGSGVNLLISSTGTVDLSGSTFIFGDGVSTTTGVDGFELNSSLPLNNVTLQTGGVALRNVSLKANTTINGNLKLISGALSLGTSTLTYGTSAVVEYAGTSAQTTGVELLTSMPNININNSNGVTLSGSTTVVNALTFTDGKLDIGANNLTINGATGSIVGASASKYVVTSGAGFLFMNPNGVNDLTYPVGPTSTSYNPFLVTDNTSSDYIGGNIKNSITNASLNDASCVQLEWKATESTTSDNDGTISFQWNASNHGASFNPAQPVYLGYWNGTGYDKTLVSVTGSDPYVVTIPAPSTIGTNPIIFGNAAAFPPDAPALTADATLNNVDNNIEITFTDDATWRAAITAVKDGANTLTATTDYTIAAGVLTLIPNSGNSLKTSGSRTITVVATGYADATVTQVISVGAINVANSTLSNTPALTSVEKTTTVTATAKDQFNNLVEGYVFKYDVTTTDGSATTDESYTVAGTAYTANATDVNLTATNASGIVTFDIVLPATIDGGDGVSVQVQLNDGTTNFKTAIGYLAPVDPAATISPASIAEHSLNNFDVNIEIQNATFAASLDKVNYILNNAPAGLTVASITRTDDTHAKLTLAYDDAGNDFDANITNFNVTVKVAELVGASADVTSNSITLTAEVEVAPTVTIADAISTLAETTAAWAGEATATGGEAITEKGVCWGTTTAPTVAGNKTTEGAGLGVITGSMTGLSANTTYYVRAYATNSIGTSYSATEKTFVTYSAEPTNHVNNFAVTPNSTNLDVSWSNNQGAVAATHYLIKASTSNNITDPTDFATVPSENLVIGSNNGVKVVDAATTSFSWSGLTANTQYFFKVYPFTKNANNLPNYKVDAAPAANATTNAAPKVETFVNFPETSTSYNTGTFVGVDGSTWSYVKCAGGSTTQIIAPSPVLGRNQSPISEVRSGTIQGGISTLGFKYMQAFSTAVSLDVFVNDTKVATVTTLSTESAVVKTVTDIPVYITGDFTIKFIQNNSSAGQVVIDDITWSSYAPTNPVVAVPVFSPGAGTYIGTQSVTLTSTTDGASIYYTTNGTTPSDASTLYTTPISLSASSTVKARAYKAGMDPSPVVSAVYVIQQPIEVANIAALRAGLTDGTAVYKLTGEAVLTFQHTTRNQKYIQDQTGGILIDDASGVITTTYNQYDGITGITGRMSLYGGLIQFTPVFNTAAASSTGNTITPQVVTLTELNTNFINYESELIKVESVTFTTTGTFVASQNLTIASGGVNSIFRTSFSTADYIGTNIPTNAKNIIGIAGHFNGAAQITARNLADFSNLTGIGDNAFSNLNAYPNPFSNEIRFEGADVARVTVTSIIGQVVLDRAIAGENYINTQELIRGIYLVKFTNKKGESILRKLIKE